MSTRYAVAIHRVKDAERCQDRSEQLSWAGNEMASIIRDGDSTQIEAPIAWAGLGMALKTHHEIAAAFETEHNVLTEVEERAVCVLKQVISYNHTTNLYFIFLQISNRSLLYSFFVYTLDNIFKDEFFYPC